MKNSFLLVLMLLVSHLAFSQFIINGTVRDKKSGQPVTYATVVLDQIAQATATDDKGNFNIRNVSAGRYQLEIRHVGYTQINQELTVSGNVELVIEMSGEITIQSPIEITATRANEKSAMAYSAVSKEQLEKMNSGRDIPYLLESIPSLVATSDAGTGIGYTGLRLRGSDPTRINVVIDGIPVNDSESQLTYWVDLPDLASSVDNIQVQRGVGTSTNGASAFGGSVNIQSAKPSEKPYFNTSGTIGSFNTIKTTAMIGTGMIDNKWNFEGRLSKITSDGYVDRASSDLKSFYISGGYYGKSDIVKLKIYSGKEITYQSWYGVPEAALDTNRTFNYYTYENQVDNYQQDHYQLFYTHIFSDKLKCNTALHYTSGKGYYEEYKENEYLYTYNLGPFFNGNDTLYYSNLVRRKWLENDFYGAVFSIQYDPVSKLNIIAGGAWNQYDGNHFGEVIWAQYGSLSLINHPYYDNNGYKTDFNIYTKVTVNLLKKLDVFADMQYRNIDYEFMGLNNSGEEFPQHDNVTFFNPKGGITYTVNPGQYGYLSFSVGNKEPSRDDYIESTNLTRPMHETLYDLECGYQHKRNNYSFGFNYFLMTYNNQLVLTGELNDVGNYTRTNIKKSFREGIEIEGQVNPVKKLTFQANISLSRNKIKEYREYYDDYDNGGQVLQVYNNTNIAFSPGFTAFLAAGWKPIRGMELQLVTKYIGEQFLDNTSNSKNKLDPYIVSDFRLGYEFKPGFMKSIVLSVMINNIFDEQYESNGYAYSYFYGGEKITERFYYPQAGRNFMGMMTLKF